MMPKRLQVGEIMSIESGGPKRNLRVVVSDTEVSSEISSPPGAICPQSIDHYEPSGMQASPGSLITLTLVLTDQRRIDFYSTRSQFDMALLLDQLDGTIGLRKREVR
jgi:hypothetical protein